MSPETLRTMPLRLRMTELMGSLAFAFVGTAVVTCIVAVLSPAVQSATRIALFAAATLAGTWGVLIAAKPYEGTSVRGGRRRFAQLLAGCLVGAAAFAVHQFLLVQFQPYDYTFKPEGIFRNIGSIPLTQSLQPTLAGYMLFFGGLFLVRHWWQHADSLRSRRVQIGSVLLTTLVGFVLSPITSFPLIWAAMWAASISSVVQLSAPWYSRDERHELTEGSHVR